jgi:hypothetical protein
VGISHARLSCSIDSFERMSQFFDTGVESDPRKSHYPVIYTGLISIDELMHMPQVMRANFVQACLFFGLLQDVLGRDSYFRFRLTSSIRRNRS